VVSDARLTAWVSGRVQGVGFRWWARSQALAAGLDGWARNLPDGRVEIVAEGARGACEELLAALRGPGSPGHLTGVVERWTDSRGVPPGFFER
jgi:acylphosphatase